MAEPVQWDIIRTRQLRRALLTRPQRIARSAYNTRHWLANHWVEFAALIVSISTLVFVVTHA